MELNNKVVNRLLSVEIYCLLSHVVLRRFRLTLRSDTDAAYVAAVNTTVHVTQFEILYLTTHAAQLTD